MAFTQKVITASITLAQGSFAGTTGQNTVTLTNYRMSAKITKAGGNSQGSLFFRVYGLDLSLMNQLSTLGKTPIQIDSKNQVSISAGDAEAGVALVFVGTISEAYINLSAPPYAIFEITAYAGLGQALQTIPPSSFPGSVDVANILSGLATQGGLDFVNNGVSVMLHPGAYFPGSVLTQIQEAANAAGINFIVDNGQLAIWPKTGTRGGQIPLISPTSTPPMIGYPFPSGQGRLGVKTQFNPQISYGGQIQVASSILPANGPAWSVVKVDHELECQFPGGKWETTITALPVNYLP